MAVEINSLRVGAVILAAGASSRLGKPKQILKYNGMSLLRRAAFAALNARCRPIVVVTGANAEMSRVELGGLDICEVYNSHWETGMASSIRAGIEGLISAENDIDAAVLMLCDQPHLTADVISRLLSEHAATNGLIIASAYGGDFGVPALFKRELFAELLQLEGRSGAKGIIKRHSTHARFLLFEGGAIDVDTQDDYSRLMQL